MRTPLASCLLAASIVSTVAGCQSGMHWPRWDWWRNTSANNPDQSPIARSASPQLPQLPSAGAMPAATTANADTRSSAPAPGAANVSGTDTQAAGAVPVSYPTTPYPSATYAAVQAVGQSAATNDASGTPSAYPQTPPNAIGVPPLPVQTGPYRAIENGEPAGIGGNVAAPLNSPPAYDNAVPDYRTADARQPERMQDRSVPTNPIEPPLSGNVVGNRYAQGAEPAVTPNFPMSAAATGTLQQDLNPPGNLARNAAVYGSDQTEQLVSPPPAVPTGDGRYGEPIRDPYADPQDVHSVPSPAPATGPQNTPPAAAYGLPPTGNQLDVTTNSPSGWAPTSQPAGGPAESAGTTLEPGHRPGYFRPGGTSDYVRPQAQPAGQPIVPIDNALGASGATWTGNVSAPSGSYNASQAGAAYQPLQAPAAPSNSGYPSTNVPAGATTPPASTPTPAPSAQPPFSSPNYSPLTPSYRPGYGGNGSPT